MGRWWTGDFVCVGCSDRFDVLVRIEDGQAHPETQPCPGCGAEATYAPSFGSNMKVALPDGTKRFADIKAGRVLEKAAKEAKRKGDKAEVKKITTEKHKLLRS